MKKRHITTCLLLTVTLLSLCVNTAAASSSEKLWFTNIDKAVEQAQKTNRPILVDFSGSDWCIWCQRLDSEVFQTDAFKKWAKDSIVLCLIDLPQDKSAIGEEKYAENAQMAKKYNVKGFPTVLLLDSDGNVFSQTGYQKGGAEAYIPHLESLMAGKDWKEQLLAIDSLDVKKQLELATTLIKTRGRELQEDQIIKLASIVFTKDPKDSTKMRAGAAIMLAGMKKDNSKEALQWLKKTAEAGNSVPYSQFLFADSIEEFTKFAALIDASKGTVLTSKDVQKTGKALLESTKEMEKWTQDPKLKAQINIRKILILGATGKTDDAIALIDETFKTIQGGQAQGENLKNYIKSIK